jgi:hypothetical protein
MRLFLRRQVGRRLGNFDWSGESLQAPLVNALFHYTSPTWDQMQEKAGLLAASSGTILWQKIIRICSFVCTAYGMIHAGYVLDASDRNEEQEPPSVTAVLLHSSLALAFYRLPVPQVHG